MSARAVEFAHEDDIGWDKLAVGDLAVREVFDECVVWGMALIVVEVNGFVGAAKLRGGGCEF